MTYTFGFEGIDCANCASKIEIAMKREAYFTDVAIYFMLQKIEVSVDKPLSQEQVQEKVEEYIRKIEEDVRIFPFNNKQAIKQEKTACTETCCTYKVSAYDEEAERNDLWIKITISTLIILLGYRLGVPELTIGAYLLMGYDVILKALRNISKGKVFDEHFLMTLATLAALGIGEYTEAVAVMVFYQVGEYFQGRAVAKSRRAIGDLLDIKPDKARVYRESQWVEIQPEEIIVGELLQVRAGEKIPLDGMIVKGKTLVDTSMLTGESIPNYKEEGMCVLSGGINLESIIEIEVTHSLKESTISKIIEMIEHASAKKAVTEQFITKFARWYTPSVVVLAVLVAIIPSILTGNWEHWIYTSIVFLVISCPCALVISVPLGFFGGIGRASKAGILIKGSNYLEVLALADTIVFDKTGTLTKGTFEVTMIHPLVDGGEDALLALACTAERYSNHPIAKAIIVAAKERGILENNWVSTENYREEAGYGITAVVEGKSLFVGNDKLMIREGIDYIEEKALGTWIYVATEEGYQGAIGVTDVIKEDTKEAIIRLRDCGIEEMVMLSGDKKEVADFVGKEVGIDTVYSELLPQDKVKKLEGFIDKGHKAIFVGDGVNDAPALMLADVGVAMGGIGSDAAVEASDVVIMTDSLVKISEAIAIARYTRRIVIQNIILSLGTKGIVMILSLVGITHMWVAIFADVGVSILAILNAIRVLNYPLRTRED